MRAWIVVAALVLAACTPRDNRDSQLELEHAPEEAVHAEPTVTGGAYDSIVYRVERAGGLEAAAERIADSADLPVRSPGGDGAGAVRTVPDSMRGDSLAAGTSDTAAQSSSAPH